MRFGVNNNASQACARANSSFFVEFQTEYGDLPLLKAVTRNSDGTFRLTRDGGAKGGIVQVAPFRRSKSYYLAFLTFMFILFFFLFLPLVWCLKD